MPPARLLMTAVVTASAIGGAFALGFAAGVDEAGAAHVAIDDLVAAEVDRVIAGELAIDLPTRGSYRTLRAL
jgi:hypothetical protein